MNKKNKAVDENQIIYDSKIKADYAQKLGLNHKKRKKIKHQTFVSQDVVDNDQRKKGKKRKIRKIERLSYSGNSSDGETKTVLIAKRSSNDMPKSAWAKTKSILSYGIVCILAVILGFMAGNMYIQATFSPSYDFTESDYRYTDIEIQAIISGNKSVSSTNSLYAFIIAEEKLKTLDNYTIETPKGSSYTAPSIAPVQSIYSLRKKTGSKYEYLTITEGIMSVSEKVITTDNGANFDIWRTKSVSNGEPKFSTDPSYKMTYEETRAEYGTDMTNPIPYVVSNKTIHSSYGGEPINTGFGTKTEDGNYKFTLKLNTTQSVMNYVKQMKHMSELGNYPSFAFIDVEFVLDDEFRFVSISIKEEYTVTYFGVPAKCSAAMQQVFTY